MKSYPIQLVGLGGRPVLVSGAGSIAARKVEELLEVGACVHVVSLDIGESMTALLPRLTRVQLRAVRDSDVEGMALVVAATNDVAANRSLAAAATALGVWVNSVDDPEACTFFASAVVRRGPVSVAIGTAGSSPLLAGRLRRVLEALLPESLTSVGELLVNARRRGVKGMARRGAIVRALADPHLERRVDRGDLEGASERLQRLLRQGEAEFPPGSVAIVGAGPGARDLLTLRALDRIHRADVVLHDALVDEVVLEEALPGTVLVNVGRRAIGGGPSQQETEDRMIAEARRGRRVVRLHGGDPFVFGRGGEEIDALESAGVSWEAVPGVSSVLAAPASAGIPLTRRHESRGITIRTGHTRDGYVKTTALPTEEDTLVILMGVGGLPQIMEGLVEEGWQPSTPAAVVSNASRPDQAVLVGTIETLAELAAQSPPARPATIVVGRVAKRAEQVASLGLQAVA